MIRINDIIDKVSEYDPEGDLGIIDRAYIYSARVHEGQTRLSGEPYLSHPLEVAGILSNMKLDTISVVSGLLHDVIEDTNATPEDIKKVFPIQYRMAVKLFNKEKQIILKLKELETDGKIKLYNSISIEEFEQALKNWNRKIIYTDG